MQETARPGEQRRYPRALVARPVQFQHEGVILSGLLWELSEGGARLQTGVPLAEGGGVRLQLPLDAWRGSPDGCELEGKVVRSSSGQVAVAFPERLLPRHRLLLRDFVWRSGVS
jgi:hypothetical protein